MNYFANGHGDGGTLVALVVSIVSDERAEVVLDTDGSFRLAGEILHILQHDGRRRRVGQVQGESVSILAQFLQQFFLICIKFACQMSELWSVRRISYLETVEFGLLAGRDDLFTEQSQFLDEFDSHHFIRLATVSQGDDDLNNSTK